jgi:hypothetical protein
MQGTKSEGNGIRSGTSRSPYVKCHRKTGQRIEEVAEGAKPRCRVMRRAKTTDPRRLWIPREVGSRLQEGVPPCSSGMA